MVHERQIFSSEYILRIKIHKLLKFEQNRKYERYTEDLSKIIQ